MRKMVAWVRKERDLAHPTILMCLGPTVGRIGLKLDVRRSGRAVRGPRRWLYEDEFSVMLLIGKGGERQGSGAKQALGEWWRLSDN